MSVYTLIDQPDAIIFDSPESTGSLITAIEDMIQNKDSEKIITAIATDHGSTNRRSVREKEQERNICMRDVLRMFSPCIFCKFFTVILYFTCVMYTIPDKGHFPQTRRVNNRKNCLMRHFSLLPYDFSE